MSFNKTTRPYSGPKGKRVLIGETREEEAARLEKEIAAHPVTRCEPGAVWRDHNGYLMVNYDRIGLKFMTWKEWLARTSVRYQSAY
jgi:hypothetical protein